MSEIFSELPDDVRELIEAPLLPFDQLESVDGRGDVYDLGERGGDSIKVHLLYRKVANTVLVHLEDEREGEEIEKAVPSDRALDAFNHPFAYTAKREAA
jgi:hypothetical protein